MPLSSYQVEWLIHQRRRWLGLLRMVGRKPAGEDRVDVSPAGNEKLYAEGRGGVRLPTPYQLLPVDVEDRRPRDQVVIYEMERRAGSFMRPTYPPYPPPAGIPKVRRRAQKEEG